MAVWWYVLSVVATVGLVFDVRRIVKGPGKRLRKMAAVSFDVGLFIVLWRNILWGDNGARITVTSLLLAIVLFRGASGVPQKAFTTRTPDERA